MEKTSIPAGSLPPLPEHLSNLVASINALISKFDDKYTDMQNAIDYMYAELNKIEATYAKKAVQIIAGTNLSGGGDLSENRTINLANASTSVRGAVQLSTAIDSTSTELAATPSAVKVAYDKAAAAEETANNKLDKTGNAVSASKLETARKIALDGDITGEGLFDGSEDITINATIAIPTGPTVTWNDEVNEAPKKNDIHYTSDESVLQGPPQLINDYQYPTGHVGTARIHHKGFNWFIDKGVLFKVPEDMSGSMALPEPLDLDKFPQGITVTMFHATEDTLAVFGEQYTATSIDAGLSWQYTANYTVKPNFDGKVGSDGEFFYHTMPTHDQDDIRWNILKRSSNGIHWSDVGYLKYVETNTSDPTYVGVNSKYIVVSRVVTGSRMGYIDISHDKGHTWNRITITDQPDTLGFDGVSHHMYDDHVFVCTVNSVWCVDMITNTLLWEDGVLGDPDISIRVFTDGGGNVYLDNPDTGVLGVKQIADAASTWQQVPLDPPRIETDNNIVYAHNKNKSILCCQYASDPTNSDITSHARFIIGTSRVVDQKTHSGTEWLASPAVGLGVRVDRLEQKTTTDQTRKITISSDLPSGGSHGDIWIQYI